MTSFLARLFITAFGLWLADQLLGGIRFDTTFSLLIAAFLLGIVNAVVRPIVVFLTFPITFLTLGLFIFVINGAMVLLVARFMPTFHTDGLTTAIIASVIVSLTSWGANKFVGKEKRRS
jgi:putative membrane protein